MQRERKEKRARFILLESKWEFLLISSEVII